MDKDRIIRDLIARSIAYGSALALETYGVVSGEKSQRQCRAIYGSWFDKACADGRLHTFRIEEGRAGTRWYRVQDILALRLEDAAKPALAL